jgi:hypothetical protein
MMQLKHFGGLRRRAESVPNGPAGLSDESARDSEAVPA